MKGILYRSMEKNMAIQVIYLSAKNKLTHRKILVKDINGTTVLAYCFTRRQMRIFKLENILSLMPEKEQTYRKIS
ncbi:WYL domain-containing protein [Bacillus infantis]|jgi:predicted DNA-binding transcriptional regulator YafY|uniref:WYL domain-containing protein n=1 Tax=Bacillus infantis TaxID=324767 RepID=UPI0021556D8C|nr:WYL domain-containing protein [Bacillus infantis]MCR6610130.1 WYL domain-containing protein [Bacillus infantis]